ncbi:MAG: DUF2914 domain-containing protein [bacterium]|nr:DUF2914 domain-containing protein [bacterium]
MQKFKHIKDWYERYERRLSTGSLLFGFIFDSLTLQRIDALRENLWIALNLGVVAICIVLLNRRRGSGGESPEDRAREHFWLFNILQFGFGALLGGFFVFYFRSATLAAAWPFLLLLLSAMVANELFVKRYTRLAFQISFFYLSLFSFAIFLLPILLHRIGPWIFFLSGLVSLGALYLFSLVLKRFAAEQFKESWKFLARSVAAIFLVVNILYFTNLIPPIPLSLQDAGIYHTLVRDAYSGNYVVAGEEKSLLRYFHLREKVRLVPGESLFAYSAIYSPASLDTRIIHEWQYRNEKGEWVTATRIPFFLSGGRAGGFRAYSTKSHLTPGLWRVNVATPQGQLIGRLNFRVISADTRPPLIYMVKN